MKLFTLSASLFLMLTTQAQTLKKIINADIWLKADNISDTSSYWKDISGNNNNAWPFSKKINLLKSAVNFNAGVKIDSSAYSITSFKGMTGQFTAIAVYDAKMTAEEQGIWSVNINNGQDLQLTTQRITGPQSISRYSDENISFPVVNTAVQFWEKAPGVARENKITLGAPVQGMRGFSGSISEFIGFNRIVNGVEMQMLQSYLAIKYGTTLLYTDYLTSKGRIVWNYALNSQYSNSIAGIGRDDGYFLNQKQSCYASEPNMLVISADKLSASNTLNTSTLKDGDFLVWGDNGLSFNVDSTTSGGDTSTYAIPFRKWLMSVNTNTASRINSQLGFDAINLTKKPKKCWLVIDRNATGNFWGKNMEYILADSISDGKAWFNNINWDSDGSGTDIFTFSCGNAGTMRKSGELAVEPELENEKKDLYSYKLYPNPSNGNYNLELNLGQISDVTVRIYTITGKHIKEEKRKGADAYSFQGELPGGLYIIEILTSHAKEAFKLTVN